MVISANKGYVQGAFPYTKEGKKQAYVYRNKLKKKNKEDYEVVVR